MHVRPTLAWLLAGSMLACAACGGGNPAPSGMDGGTMDGATMQGDGGADGGDAGELPSGASVMAPAPPAAPTLTPCPSGWNEVAPDAGTPATCDPWPASGQATCPDDQAHFPGTPGCATLGPACPTGDFPTDLPAGTMPLYVRAGASGGDGSMAAPFGTIGEATAAATSGTTIVVAAGDYDEAVVLPDGVSLRGACVSGVHLTHSVRDGAPATVQITGTGVTVTGVRIAGARSGLLVDAGADATIDGVLVDMATETGLRVHMGGHAVLHDVAIRNTQIDPDDHTSAFGLVVELGGTAEATHLDVEHNGVAGVLVSDAGSTLTVNDSVVRDTESVGGTYGVGIGSQSGAVVHVARTVVAGNHYFGVGAGHSSTVDIEDSVVRDTTAQDSGGTNGYGIMADSGGALHVTRCLVEDNVLAGLFGGDSGTTVDASDVVVRGTRADPTGNGGPGLFFGGGATATVQDVVVDDNQTAGIYISDMGTHVTLMDAAVLSTIGRPSDGSFGRGVVVQRGAALDFARVEVAHDRNAGMWASDDGTTAHGQDLTVMDTLPEATGPLRGIGVGLTVQYDATCDVDRVSIEGSRGWGAVLTNAGTQASLTDLRIDGTLPWDREPYLGMTTLGRGLELQSGASAQVERAVVSNNHEIGVMVIAGSTLSLTDAVVRDTASEVSTHMSGRGIEAYGGAQVMLDGVRLERNREIGLSAYDDGTTVTATNLDVLDTMQSDCAHDTCPDQSAGMGVGAYDGASVTLSSFLVTRSALCGVQVTNGAGLDLSNGEVSHGPIGANVQDPTFDLSRLQNHVVFRDNQTNLDATTLPVPDPSGAFMVPSTM